MYRLLSVCFVALLASTISVQAAPRGPDRFSPQANQSNRRVLRVLMEGDGPALPEVIEELRKQSDEYDLDIEFASGPSTAYDARIVVTGGKGKTWAPTSAFHPTEPASIVFYFFSMASVFDRGGRLVFTSSGSGDFADNANRELAKELIRKLSGTYAQLRGAGSVGPGSANQPGPSAEEPAEVAGMPGPPGVYYRRAGGWAEMREAASSASKAKGVPEALLTWGFAGIRVLQVYSGAHASAQIADSSPVFYVRGLGIDSRNAVIVRLNQKKDHREINMGSVRPFIGRSGYPADRLTDVSLRRVSPDVVAVRPLKPLEPGEYILSLYATDTGEGFDFGIVK